MRTKTLIAVYISLVAQVSTAQITFTNLGVSNPTINDPDIFNDNNSSSYLTSAQWTPPTSGLIIVFVTGDKNTGSSTPTTPTMSGNSLTWTQIGTTLDCTGRVGLSLFAANASGSTTGFTTIQFGGVTQTRCYASFFKADGVNLSGGVAAAFVQTQSNAATVSELTITLNSAQNANNRAAAGFDEQNTITVTHRTNWTELDESGVAEGILETQYRSDAFETTASASYGTSVVCCGVAFELKAAAVGGNTARVIIINNQD